MNLAETSQMLSILKVYYPHAFKGISEADAKATVMVWQFQLKDYAYSDVIAAIHFMGGTRREGYTPVPADIKDALWTMKHPLELTESEAWGLVLKAVSRSGYHSQEEWEKLPEEVRRAITPEALREMALSEDFNPAVEGSNFMRSFRQKKVIEKQQAMIPAETYKELYG